MTRSSTRRKPSSSRLCGLTFPSTTGSQRLPSRSCLHHPFRVSIWHVGIPCKATVQPTSLTGNRNGNSTVCRLRTAECLQPTTSRIEDHQDRHAAMFPWWFFIIITIIPHSRPPVQPSRYSYWKGQLLSTETAERRRRQRKGGGLFLLTCSSSSLHTATSGDCCSPAAYQCVYLLCSRHVDICAGPWAWLR